MSEIKENPLLNKFAIFLREKRTALGISQTELAVMLYNNKKRKTFISEIELGTRKGLSIQTMNDILDALNSEIEFIEK